MKYYLSSKIKNSRGILFALICMFISLGNINAQSFKHPGILHTQEDFDRMAQKVNANEQPWIGGYDLLVNSSEAQLSWTPRATATIIRGGTGDNVALLYRDVQAAYQHALIYKITGNTAHGDKARDILNAWSSTHTTLTGNADRYLASGLFGYQFANAAEMMRGYSGFDIGRFQNYLLNVYYYPLVERFLVGNDWGADHNDACITNYWANWDLCNMAAMIAIGVFCDNRDIYNKGIEYFKNGAGNGSITHAVPFIHSSTLGQWQESGRDQGHSILGIGLMASFCEIAWNQGDDMYGYDDSRFRKGAEYVACYNMGQSVPFTTYSWGSGTNCAYNEQTVVSSAGRGELRPIWEMIYNHYANVKGQAGLIPYIQAEADQLRPEGGPGGHATTYDQPGFGSLTHYGEIFDNAPSGGVSWESYNFPGYFIRHQNNVGRIDPNVIPVDDKQWYMVGGLADPNGVSFESVNYPGQYLRHYNYELILGSVSNSTQEGDATFYIRDGLTDASLTSFESYNFPGYYIRHANYVLRIDQISSSLGEQDATFRQIGDIIDGAYVQVKNRGTGLVLDGMGRTTNGDACGQYENSTTHVNSHWELIRAGGNNYQLRNSGTGLYLDGMGRTSNGADVAQYANTTSTNAQWSVQQYDGNYYRIQNVATGLYLDGMGRTSNGANCGQYANTTSNNAQWELITVLSARVGYSAKVNDNTTSTENQLISNLQYYPNPASSVLSINLPEEFEKGDVKIVDLHGKVLMETEISTKKQEVNVNVLEPGIYILRITNNADQSWSGKFIKK